MLIKTCIVLLLVGTLSYGTLNLLFRRLCVNSLQPGVLASQCALCNSLTFTSTLASCLGTTSITNVTTAQAQCLLNGCNLSIGKKKRNIDDSSAKDLQDDSDVETIWFDVSEMDDYILNYPDI
ncbi:uncharacterized protein LOC143224256 [Tachypleus tridentatus]|uniref:uncharacterized protein LOC143224256 n=1 Tax=Tachypleus tridentatus TaxID=6853 RepID=UPI003FD123BA